MPRKPLQYKPWLKFYSKPWLHGSLRFDCTPEERSVWADLLALGNESRNRGVIQANDDTPYPHPWLANQLNISLELLERCLAKFTTQERIHVNETGIHILNFDWYQKQFGLKRKAEPVQEEEKGLSDPDKYTKGRYGDMVVTDQLGIDKIQEERKRRSQ